MIDDKDLDDLPQIDSKEDLNRTREILEEDLTNEKPQVLCDLELKSTNSKRVSLISTSGFVRPNISSNENLNVFPSPSSSSKLASKLTPPSQVRSPKRSQIVQNFEFKKPAVPNLPSPTKLATSRLPTSSNLTRTSIPMPSLTKPSLIQKSKTLGINTSTSNILKPSTSLPFQKITQNTITDKRVTISSNSRLAMSVQSAKENNCSRLSFSSKSIGLTNKTNLKGSTLGNSKAMKISQGTNSKIIPPQISKPSKVSSIIELKYLFFKIFLIYILLFINFF